jgi:hypothetical protein
MIRITNQEQIKKSGNFRIDGLHIKRFHFDLQPETGAGEELTIECVPFATMEDGSKIHDLTRIYKVSINDLQEYLVDNPDVAQAVGAAYYATEAAIAQLINKRNPELQAVFEAPQS